MAVAVAVTGAAVEVQQRRCGTLPPALLLGVCVVSCLCGCLPSSCRGRSLCGVCGNDAVCVSLCLRIHCGIMEERSSGNALGDCLRARRPPPPLAPPPIPQYRNTSQHQHHLHHHRYHHRFTFTATATIVTSLCSRLNPKALRQTAPLPALHPLFMTADAETGSHQAGLMLGSSRHPCCCGGGGRRGRCSGNTNG
jgi:hypothetical protein